MQHLIYAPLTHVSFSYPPFVGKWPFFVMGGLDAIAGIMQVFAATYLPGPLLILLSQAAIPMSMLISKYLLKSEYTPFQYLGATIVACGIATVLVPTISGDGSVLWAVVMIASTVPMALSSVYKEIALGTTELDPIFLNGWIAVFQVRVCVHVRVCMCVVCVRAECDSAAPHPATHPYLSLPPLSVPLPSPPTRSSSFPCW